MIADRMEGVAVGHDPMGDVVSMLKIHEGFRSKIYLDSVGVMTIGYGINLEHGITEREAAFILEERVRKLRVRLAIIVKFWHELSDTRRDVLVMMAYNLGISGLMGFKNTLAAMEVGDFEHASVAMLNSVWAGQVGNRADYLSELMRDG